MTSPQPEPLERTQHRNLVTGTDLGGSTVHRESRIDIEDYLEPITAVRTKALHGPGVATGLHVTATKNQPGLQITPGVAIDQRGRTVALQDGGVAVTDPNADATTARNVPTVDVTPTGITLDTTGLTGDRMLTVAWAEAEAGNATLLRHAPWIQLLPPNDPDAKPAADAVTLAHVILDTTGAVTALTAGTRENLPARLRLRPTRETGGAALAVDVDPSAAAELRARPDGGLDIIAAGTTTPALSVLGTGALAASGDLSVTGVLTAASSTVATLTTTSLTTASLRANSLRAGTLTIDGATALTGATTVGGALAVAGRTGIGVAPGAAQRSLHVEGSEIHSGGPGGGFSFADRGHAAFVEAPANGQRWVWYASGGSARLWSGGDRLSVSPTGSLTVGVAGRADLRVSGNALVGAGGGGTMTVRHVDGKSHLNDDPDDLFLNWGIGRGVHVGGAARASLNVHGPINWDDEHADRNHLRLGKLQLCWGAVPLAQRQGETLQRIDFATAAPGSVPFVGSPVVTASINDPGYGVSSLQAGVGPYQVDSTGFTALYKSNTGRTGTVLFTWIAVGRWT